MRHCLFGIFTVFALLLLSIGQVFAMGNLVIAPTRVVFDDKTRAASIELMNRGNKRETYRISLVNKRMDRDGQFTDVAKDETPHAGERFADSYIRIAPRQVSLEAGERQKVRLFLRPKAGMENGEYRTHLLAVGLPDASTSGAANADKDEKDIVLQLPVAIGVSIPVIIRKGQLDASGRLDNLAIVRNDKGAFVEGMLHRKGNRSLYGDLNATLTQPGKEPKIIGFIKGVSVYTPNEARKVQVPVQMPANASGTLKVTFEEPASTVSNPQIIMAEKPLP